MPVPPFSGDRSLKILWLKTELLHPVDKGGKIRTYEMLKQLKREHHITYLTLDDGTASPDAYKRAKEYCHKLVCVPHHTKAKFSPGFYLDLFFNLFSPLPYAVKKYESLEMRRQITEILESDIPDVVICDFLSPSVNVPEQLPCATILFQHNVEAMIWQRHFETQSNWLKRIYLYNQWRKMHLFEQAECRRYDKVIAVSSEDKELMERDYELKSVADVPTGVDTEYFRPNPEAIKKPTRLVFTGSMDWIPNVDAIRYFCQQILPIVRDQIPNVTLTVVGRNPSRDLIELSRKDPAITITGRVEDVRPYMDSATAYIVPIRIGGGTRLKIYEAMAMEKPIVSTTVGAEGLPVNNGEELLIADTPQSFADAVIRILSDEVFSRELGQSAAAAVRARFGWDRVAEQFTEICRQATRQRVSESTKDRDRDILPTAAEA